MVWWGQEGDSLREILAAAAGAGIWWTVRLSLWLLTKTKPGRYFILYRRLCSRSKKFVKKNLI
jgi:hypothetical protein